MTQEPASPPAAPAGWAAVAGRRAVVPEHVVFRSFALETVLLNIQTGLYHGLDDVGGRFFDTIRQSPTLSAAADTLAAEYEQPLQRIRDDLATFAPELVALGLIELASPGG